MMRVDGMKVICLTTGDLTDEWMFLFSDTRSKASCEKSAEAILAGRNEPRTETVEDSQPGEGLNLKK